MNLAETMLRTTSLTQRFDVVMSRGRGWTVAGFKNGTDEQAVRGQMRKFKQAIGFTRGVR